MGHEGRGGSRPPPWAELHRELLGEVALRVGDAKDLVRFHAVCRSWREAHPHTPGALLPWLIARPSSLYIRSPFADTSLHLPVCPELHRRRLAFSDAVNGRLLAFYTPDNDGPVASLVNPITGEAAAYFPLPDIPNPERRNDTMVSLQVAVLRLRAEETTPEKETGGLYLYPDVVDPDVHTMDVHERRAAALCASGVLRGGGACTMAKLPARPFSTDRYVLHSHGELFCVDVYRESRWSCPPHKLVFLYAMEAYGKLQRPRWVERRHIDPQVCFFLGWESSFALDAPEFGSDKLTGGCAYFVARHPKWTPVSMLHCVYRYSFNDGTATVVNELPRDFHTLSMWFVPRPRIQPPPPMRSTTSFSAIASHSHSGGDP